MRRPYYALTLLLAVSPAVAATAQTPGAGATQEAPMPGARPAPVAAMGYPPLVVDQDAILMDLRAGRFTELERLFDSLQAATRADITQELLLDASYRAFYGSDASLRGRLDEWVASNPRSDAALVARAQFHIARAWEARGEGFEIVDPAAMRASLEAGFTDVGRAYELDPDNLSVYAAGIRLQGVLGWSDDLGQLVSAGLERYPESYWLRWVTMRVMRPRWGGSHELMRAFAEDAQRYVAANPRLVSLLGTVAIDEGVELGQSQRYAEAVVKIEEARQYGPDWDFYFERGHHMYHDDRYLAAVAVIDTAVAMHPIYEDVLAYRGRALYWGARTEAPVEDRVALLANATTDFIDAAKRSQADEAISRNLANAMALRDGCAQAPADCLPSSSQVAGSPLATGPWWARAIYFVLALPLTLWMIFVDGERMHLLPAPLIGIGLCAWSFMEWRRQRFWTPRFIHIMAVLALATIVAINVDWVRVGGEMNAQRYVVIAIFGIFPYVAYLVTLGPRRVGRKRATTRAQPRPWGSAGPPKPPTINPAAPKPPVAKR